MGGVKKMTFAEKLLNFRIENNLSQKATAALFNVHQSDISEYEVGKREPNKLNRAYYERRMDNYERSKEK